MAAKLSLANPHSSGGCTHQKVLQELSPDHEPLACWYRSKWDPRLALPQLKKLAEGSSGKTMLGKNGDHSIIISNNAKVQTFLHTTAWFDIDKLSDTPEGKAYIRGQEVTCDDITYVCF